MDELCDEYRWGEGGNSENDTKDENDRAIKQWESRSLTWSETSNGNTQIQLVLPPEIAQAYLNSVEQSLNQLDTIDRKMAQCRADHPYGYKAAVLMAETSLQSAGKAISTADRYQVIVLVDASDLSAKHSGNTTDSIANNASASDTFITKKIPEKRPTVNGAGPIAGETARRISCDCSLTINKTTNGEPINIGRKSRIWHSAMERAIKQRDQHCVWPGCTQSRHLHIHHIKHWADGGSTSVSNGVCLCSAHHRLVHEGGYTIQRVDHPNGHKNDDQRLYQQFVRQQHSHDTSLFDFESSLRSSRESFNMVRKLSPTQYRFRIIDAQGEDILDQSLANVADTKQWLTGRSYQSNQSCDSTCNSTCNSTRVCCGESDPDSYYNDNIYSNAKLFTSEVVPNYALIV